MAIDVERLPYSMDKPADTAAVVKEVRDLATLVAAIVAASPRRGPEMVADATKEPGRSVALQELRLALALESYVGTEGLELITMLTKSTGEMIGASVERLESAGFIHRHGAAGSEPSGADLVCTQREEKP